MAYSDKYKKILDVICLNKMKQDRKMKKEEEEAITKIKGEALIEKEDPGAFVIPIRLEGKINLNALADTGSDINVMPYRLYMELGRKELKNVNRGITMLNHLKAELMGLMKDVQCQTSLDTTESDSDDEEEYAIQRNKFEAPIYEQKPTQYLNCNDPMDRSLALCFNKKEEGNGQWHAEIRLTDPYGNIYDQEFVTKKTSRSELCHEFCSTYEYDEVCAADELKTKKIIKFKLCGRAFSWTLLVFAKRLGLYNLKEIEEEGFDVYFLGGLHSDEHFKSSRVLVKHQAFDTTTLRELIDFEGRLILEALEPSVPRVAIPRPREHRCMIYTRGWVIWRYTMDRLRGCLIGSIITGTGMLGYLSTWLGFTVFHCREPITYLNMISISMKSIISSTLLGSSSSQMMMSSVEMTELVV
ncbi:hypothetical protein Tco_0886002 [Tanacetum coccineum]